MNIEICSDVVCPWCYTGKRRFESALAKRRRVSAPTTHLLHGADRDT